MHIRRRLRLLEVNENRKHKNYNVMMIEWVVGVH